MADAERERQHKILEEINLQPQDVIDSYNKYFQEIEQNVGDEIQQRAEHNVNRKNELQYLALQERIKNEQKLKLEEEEQKKKEFEAQSKKNELQGLMEAIEEE